MRSGNVPEGTFTAINHSEEREKQPQDTWKEEAAAAQNQEVAPGPTPRAAATSQGLLVLCVSQPMSAATGDPLNHPEPQGA